MILLTISRNKVNDYVRLMLPLARKFVYDIAPKASVFSHDVEINVSALQQLCLH